MKILYLSPENTVGTLNLWQQAHAARGNQCDFVTFYPGRHGFDPGICLNLPLVQASYFYLKNRHRYYQRFRGELGDYAEKPGYPPAWKPNSSLERWYFRWRDWLWHFKIEAAIAHHGLADYDILHLEWGLDFYRSGRFARRYHQAGKPVICTYHGQDLRTRGVIPAVDEISDLNLTSELDLLEKHPDINYLFLPFDTGQFQPDFTVSNPVRVCHSPTDRFYKGSDWIIPVGRKLADEGLIEFILIENQPNREARVLKQTCDVLIDQVGNRGGWGYGMNSVEALAMGLCCVTELVPQYEAFIPDHPFVNASADELERNLRTLVGNREQLAVRKRRSREWVVRHHDLNNTADRLYDYYHEKGWL